jgi:hypothetical protein
MRTHYLVAGMAISIVAHLLLFAPWPGANGKKPAGRKPVRVLLPSTQTKAVAQKPPEPKPEPEPKPKPQPRRAPKPPSRMKEMVRGGGRTETKKGETSTAAADVSRAAGSAAGKEKPLPPLRMDISDTDTVLTASRSLGVLLVIINGSGRVRARVNAASGKRPAAVPMSDTSGFSNRIRLLPRSGYFGSVLEKLRERYEDLPYSSRLAFLVPAGLDGRWMREQRQLLADAGGKAGDCMTVGRYVRSADGGYRLEIKLAER